MRIMKKISLFIATIMLSGCVSLHSGYMTGTAPAVENNFKYAGNAYGESQATYVLGLGGFDAREGLIREAKNNLIKNNPVKDGQVLVNLTVDNQWSSILGILWTHKVIITADILEYQE